MTTDTLFGQFKDGFPSRKFSAGLLMAFIDFLVDLQTYNLELKSLDDFYAHFPRRNVTQRGGQANTLIVERENSTLSIRKFYNEIEKLIRVDNHRFDYPSCAPHATQAWEQYTNWLEKLVSLKLEDLNSLRALILAFVLSELPSQAFDPANARKEPPLFRYILEGFDMTAQTNEKTGAAYQGMVFGFLRADNPHLQVEIRKVRAGSARTRGIGDIDCWDGASLAISAEVKQYVISSSSDFAGFANNVTRRGALGLVVGIDFNSETVKSEIEDLGVRPLSQNDLIRIVELWDSIKQRTAVSSLFYYVEHIEQSSALSSRLRAYLQRLTNIL